MSKLQQALGYIDRLNRGALPSEKLILLAALLGVSGLGAGAAWGVYKGTRYLMSSVVAAPESVTPMANKAMAVPVPSDVSPGQEPLR